MGWSAADIPAQQGRIAVVTGANSGIGLVAATELARRGADVVLACRDRAKGDAALARLSAAVPGAQAEVMPLDLADLASVAAFADALRARHARVDILINNAGLMMPPLGRTADGFELQFGTNVLGHFALTARLIDAVDAAPGGRIVSISSVAHRLGRIDFANLNAERGYSAWTAYAQSKLADLLFAYELERRLRAGRRTAISLAAHPGIAHTGLVRHGALLKRIEPWLTQPAADGALPGLRAATDPRAAGGDYYGPGGFMALRGPPGLQRSARRSYDGATAARLWRSMEALTGLPFL